MQVRLVILSVALFFNFRTSATDTMRHKVCLHPEMTTNPDVGYLKKMSGESHFIPMHLKLTTLLSTPNTKSIKIDGDGGEVKLEKCFELMAKANGTGVAIPFRCKHMEKRLKCNVRATLPPPDSKLPPLPMMLDGTFFQSKNDNNSYAVISGCLTTGQPNWFVLSSKAELKKATKEAIVNHIEELGFAAKDVSSSSDPIYLDRLKNVDCAKQQDLTVEAVAAIFGMLAKLTQVG